MSWETIQLWREILEEFESAARLVERRVHSRLEEETKVRSKGKQARRAAENRAVKALGIPCEVCGKLITKFGTRGRLPKTCSEACKRKRWRQMKKTMAVKSKGKDLPAVVKKASIDVAFKSLNVGLGALAQFVSGELAPPAIAQTFDVVKQAGDSIEAIEKNLKERILKLAATVAPSTDKGSKVVDCGSYEIPLNVRKTGLNAKAFEAMLRAKSIAPVKYMTQVISYDVSEESGVKAIADGVMTPDELELCREKLAYNIMRPIKKVVNND